MCNEFQSTTIFEIRDVLQHIISFMNLRVAFDDQGKIKESDFLSILTCFKAFHFAMINYPNFQKRFELMKRLSVSAQIRKPPSLFQSTFLLWRIFDIPLACEIFKRDYDLIDNIHNRLKFTSITSDQFITDDEEKKIINLRGNLGSNKVQVRTKPILFELELPTIVFLSLSLGAGLMSYQCAVKLLGSVKSCRQYNQVMIDAIYPACSNISFIADFSLTAGLGFIVSSAAFLFAMDTVKKDHNILCQKIALYEKHSSLFKKTDAMVDYLKCQTAVPG
ncbi:MAG: hypothetical protein A3I77_07170 [Gammaproteobacteria bacterium RIFCSPLOWO2_02_FULL_42_14]|nr:MAG: hypothetical protein A3B71_03005 [Gammaproteobacteria bacterium RIFCSPHIGHO2_02_FULL_42_43]OGT27938.1 MAG: hypothetical protein A2624_03645 [Gammaproteobacteria bacterium RIFCSPHIGHO2_01_FULL_42_8]OGT52033.1 MAG: hypothetical protein A3E54_04510 [Gammaproteobacteria bacterium RIFCSPHIGHO2_12_FULL_41_25]OGT61138.1 MAG: hypothetical protein A3I77_07170 [Gammaproteobacteria bacterium RIFCSPLOWO2_02_FULL_42_14]OGT87066.1 MAG: hypothetical protein A3G86_00890 [Gammaproteobacteria bacterium R